MGESDAELIRRWRAGEAAAFEAVVRRWETPLSRFLSRLAPADQLGDLTQEVFLRVHRAGPGYRENGHFSTWLFQIALNVARDAARRARPQQPLPEDEPPGRGEPAESVCERREAGDLVRRAVAELPRDMREVIALRHDQGISFEEMARRLGVPASTLKSRFSAALLRLRGRLRELGFRPEDQS